MLRNIIRQNSSIGSRQVCHRTLVAPRLFSSYRALLHSEDSGSKHSHTHNGAPCSGHSHSSHHHGHSHENGAVSGDRPLKMDKPMLMLAFTCKKCDTRSSHVMSKQAYQQGTILVQCPGCKSRHLVADHLKIFSDNRIKLEDIMKAQGEQVRTDTNDLIFEDIPDSLKNLIGHHAKNAPPEYQNKADTQDETLKLESNSNPEEKNKA